MLRSSGKNYFRANYPLINDHVFNLIFMFISSCPPKKKVPAKPPPRAKLAHIESNEDEGQEENSDNMVEVEVTDVDADSEESVEEEAEEEESDQEEEEPSSAKKEERQKFLLTQGRARAAARKLKESERALGDG